MNPGSIRIGNRSIGRSQEPFVIAEMSGNHNQSLDRALEIVEAASASGAHALKLQTYTPDTMTIDVSHGEFFIGDPGSLWKGSTLYDLYEVAHTPWDWHEPIMQRASELGMECFSTPFDLSAVDFLESAGATCYKIASFENADLALIKRVASTGKPVIISTGMATLAEIDEAVRTARVAGCRDLILLKCTSSYPASPKDSNLLGVPDLERMFNCQVGLSDHTKGIGVSIASVALGATVIEKHFTIDRSAGGVDAEFSLEPQEMRQLVEESRRAWESLGKPQIGPTSAEEKSIQFRRSLYIVEDMKVGDVLTRENLRAIRPGFGLPPRYLEVLLGKRIRADSRRGTAMSWDLLG
jgi:pseudaminic acid synthase